MNTEDFKALKLLNSTEDKKKSYFQRSLKYFKEITDNELYTKYRNSYIEIFSDSDKLKDYKNQVAHMLQPLADNACDYWHRDSACVGGSMKGFWEPSDFSKCRDPIRKYLISILDEDRCLFFTYSPKDMDVTVLLQKFEKFFKSKYVGVGSYYAIEFYGKDMKFRPHIHSWIKSDSKNKLRQHIKRSFGGKPAVDVVMYNNIANGVDYIRHPQSDSKMEQKLCDKDYRAQHGIHEFYYKL